MEKADIGEMKGTLFIDVIEEASEACFLVSKDHGFWDQPRNKAEQIALIHSELSEMLEGIRKPQSDPHCPEFTSEEIEAADVLIRLFDYAHGHDLRLAEAFVAKFKFNVGRAFKHGKQF